MAIPTQRASISPLGLGALTFLIHTAAALVGLSDAKLWSQVIHLWDHNWTIANWHIPISDAPLDQPRLESVKHAAHRLRYFLTYPMFWIGDRYDVPADSVFTALVPILAASTVWSAAKIVVRLSDRSLTKTSALFLLPLVFVFLAMDGRLIFAYCGFALLMYVNIPPVNMSWCGRALGTLAAFFLTAVSSGTFCTALVTLALLTAIHFCQGRDVFERIQAPLLLGWIIMVYNQDLAGVLTKNLRYFGGGLDAVSGLLAHGFGTVFMSTKTAIAIPLIALLCLALGMLPSRILPHGVPEPVMVLVLGATIAMGMVGWSILTLAIIPMCVLTALLAIRGVSAGRSTNAVEAES